MGNLFYKLNLEKNKMSTVVDWSIQPGLLDVNRKVTWWQDCVGAIATVFSVIAGVINLAAWAADGGTNSYWATTWATELAWSGIIEVGAITAVFVTDSDILRAIGGWSMVLVNATSATLIAYAESNVHSAAFLPTFALHCVAFGQ